MSETKIVIPCEVLKRITPLLKECISYEPVMFIDVFRKMEAIILWGKITDNSELLKEGIHFQTQEEMDFYLRKRAPEDFLSKYDSQDPYTLVYECGNNIELTTNFAEGQPTFSIKDFDILWDKDNLPHDDYYYAFLVLIAVYAKYIYTGGMFEGYISNEYYIRGEQLKLYEFLHKNYTSKSDIFLKISINGTSLKIDNMGNWLKDAVYRSIGEEMDIEAVQQELSDKYLPKTQKGRKTKPEYGNILLSAYNLIHKTDLMTNNKVILSDNEANFIINFCQYLHLDAFKKANTEYMRAMLAHYQLKKSPIKWWAFE